MKSTASIQNSMFFNSPLPMSGQWGEASQRIIRRRSRSLRLPTFPNTDELATTKQEVVCGSILALCLFYTFAHFLIQLAA